MKDRRQAILDLLSTNKYMTFEVLSQRLHYSESTIRRDCTLLNKEGLLKKKRGGVLYLDQHEVEAPNEYKQSINPKEKDYIANLASAYLQPAQTIFLDSSSSSNALSKYLSHFDSLNIYTTNIMTALYASKNTKNIVNIIGGQLRDVMVNGTEAIWSISHMNYDIAFISCRGIDITHGVTDRLQNESSIKRIIGSHTKKLILLADSSKFDQIFTYLDFKMNSIDALVTDKKPTQNYIDFCDTNQIELVY